jgi:GAF domain-containing protein
MTTKTITEFERLIETLEKRAEPVDAELLTRVAQQVGKLFRVDPDEVAVLQLARSGKSLIFVIPEQLRAVGTLPLSSTSALAARTARERRQDIVNNFASSRHASVFEGVPLGRAQGETIQKIISVPILRGDKVIGVAQVSRKGQTAAESGPDFTSKDLSELQSLNGLLDRFLALVAAT